MIAWLFFWNSIVDYSLRRVNATFVSLIPNKVGVVVAKDFLPISLVGGVCKIIFNLLATRFKSVL